MLAPTQLWIGWSLIGVSAVLIAWGVKSDGEHWWHKDRIRMTWPYTLMAICLIGFCIGAWFAWNGHGSVNRTQAAALDHSGATLIRVKRGIKRGHSSV